LKVSGLEVSIGLLGWAPSTPLRHGIEKTYAWIYDQYMAREKGLAHRV